MKCGERINVCLLSSISADFLFITKYYCEFVINTFKKKQGRIHGYLSRVQGLYLRSLHNLGRSSEAKDRKNPRKVKCDGPTDEPTDGPTKRGVKLRSTRLKILAALGDGS